MGTSLLVAIVDDERDLVDVLRRILSRHGIAIAFVAYSGIEAVDKFKRAETKPGVIIMDYRMPGLNGDDAAKEILTISPKTKIIFLTGQSFTEKQAIEAGGVAFLNKPASLRKLLETIQSTADHFNFDAR